MGFFYSPRGTIFLLRDSCESSLVILSQRHTARNTTGIFKLILQPGYVAIRRAWTISREHDDGGRRMTTNTYGGDVWNVSVRGPSWRIQETTPSNLSELSNRNSQKVHGLTHPLGTPLKLLYRLSPWLFVFPLFFPLYLSFSSSRVAAPLNVSRCLPTRRTRDGHALWNAMLSSPPDSEGYRREWNAFRVSCMRDDRGAVVRRKEALKSLVFETAVWNACCSRDASDYSATRGWSKRKGAQGIDYRTKWIGSRLWNSQVYNSAKIGNKEQGSKRKGDLKGHNKSIAAVSG